MKTEKCPKCSSQFKYTAKFNGDILDYYKCESIFVNGKLNTRSPLCLEREARIKAEGELSQAKRDLQCCRDNNELREEIYIKQRDKAEEELAEVKEKHNSYRKEVRSQEREIIRLGEENQKLRELLERAVKNAQALYDNPICEDHDIGQCRSCHEGAALEEIKKELEEL